MRNAYIRAIQELAGNDERIMALVADNGAIVFDSFRRDFPDRFINFGIAEANMVSVAAGLAACGKIPFAYTIAGFLTMRAFEQVRNDVCMQRQNVKLVGVGGGMAYSNLGPTHHSLEDVAVMRVLPEMKIICPGSPKEAYAATIAAATIDAPVYLRLEATKEKEIYEGDCHFEIGKGVILREGSDIAIISYGSIISEALTVAADIEKLGVSVAVVNMPTVKPIDADLIESLAGKVRQIISLEEHNIIGGLGSAVGEVLLERDCRSVKFTRMGVNDAFAVGYGPRSYLRDQCCIGTGDILRACQE